MAATHAVASATTVVLVSQRKGPPAFVPGGRVSAAGSRIGRSRPVVNRNRATGGLRTPRFTSTQVRASQERRWAQSSGCARRCSTTVRAGCPVSAGTASVTRASSPAAIAR